MQVTFHEESFSVSSSVQSVRKARILKILFIDDLNVKLSQIADAELFRNWSIESSE